MRLWYPLEYFGVLIFETLCVMSLTYHRVEMAEHFYSPMSWTLLSGPKWTDIFWRASTRLLISLVGIVMRCWVGSMNELMRRRRNTRRANSYSRSPKLSRITGSPVVVSWCYRTCSCSFSITRMNLFRFTGVCSSEKAHSVQSILPEMKNVKSKKSDWRHCFIFQSLFYLLFIVHLISVYSDVLFFFFYYRNVAAWVQFIWQCCHFLRIIATNLVRFLFFNYICT